MKIDGSMGLCIEHNNYIVDSICSGCVCEYYEAEIAMMVWGNSLPFWYLSFSKEALEYIKNNNIDDVITCGTSSFFDYVDNYMCKY